MKRRENNKVVDKIILINLYDIHSMNEMCKILDIGRIRLEKLFEEYGIEKKTMSEIQNKKSVKDKIKKTLNEIYGDNWGFNSDKYKTTINEKYGGNPMNSDDIKEKIKKTNLEKYGYEYYTQTDDYKERVLISNLEKYGTDNPSKNIEIKKKIKETKSKKYGYENYNNTEKNKKTVRERYGVDNINSSVEIKNKKIETCLINHGVKYPLQSAIVQDKARETMLKKYGVKSAFLIEENITKAKLKLLELYNCEHGFQNEIIQRKCFTNGFRLKKYIFPSGRIDHVLGYEPYMLDILLKDENINENDILTNFDCPKINWVDADNKTHNHIPDIYIKSENKIIEVKSEYTASDKYINAILLKKVFGEKSGFIYKIFVMDKKTKKIKYEIN